MTAPLLLDLAGRLHRGDRALPWAPASSIVGGTVPQIIVLGTGERVVQLTHHLAPLGPRADVMWRETTMERWERQKERGT